jgi:hypothetical protein
MQKQLRLLVMLLIIAGIGQLHAEAPDSAKSYRYLYSSFLEAGRVQTSNVFLQQNSANNEEFGEFTAFSFRIMKQTTGKKLWEKYYNYPSYGVGIFFAKFFEKTYLSTPISIYGTYKQVLYKWDKLNLNYNAGFGVTLNWESYNPTEYNYNISIGATLTSYINAGMYLTYELSPTIDLGLGYSFTHFSNGAMKIPNFGLNTSVPRITVDYIPHRFTPPKIKAQIPRYERKTFVNLSVYGGEKNVLYPEADMDTTTQFYGISYPVFGVNAIIYRQLGYISRVGIGFTLGYDGSKNSSVQLENGKPDPNQHLKGSNITLSIYPSYEWVFNKVSLFAQPSFYLIKNQTTYQRPTFFTRVGINYRILPNTYMGIGLHSYNYHIADFLEWTVGHQFPL